MTSLPATARVTRAERTAEARNGRVPRAKRRRRDALIPATTPSGGTTRRGRRQSARRRSRGARLIEGSRSRADFRHWLLEHSALDKSPRCAPLLNTRRGDLVRFGPFRCPFKCLSLSHSRVRVLISECALLSRARYVLFACESANSPINAVRKCPRT